MSEVRDGGPYADVEQLKAAEIKRAAVEGREPDFSGIPTVIPRTGFDESGQILLATADPASNNLPTADPSQLTIDVVNGSVAEEVAQEEQEATDSATENVGEITEEVDEETVFKP